MSEECPNCGAPYSERVTVAMGDRYTDVFGRTPRSFFTDYARVCPDPGEAQRASREAHVDLDVYLHRFGDLSRGVGTAD